MNSIDFLYHKLTHVELDKRIEKIAADLGYDFDTEACQHGDCFAVINDNLVKAIPFKDSLKAPWDKDFFLLTTIPELGALFHRERNKPVWFCQYIDELRQINIPNEAGQKWAYFLTDAEEGWEAQIKADLLCRHGRVVSVNSGTCLDQIRTFFPEEWEKINPDR